MNPGFSVPTWCRPICLINVRRAAPCGEAQLFNYGLERHSMAFNVDISGSLVQIDSRTALAGRSARREWQHPCFPQGRDLRFTFNECIRFLLKPRMASIFCKRSNKRSRNSSKVNRTHWIRSRHAYEALSRTRKFRQWWNILPQI
jgi:hypothetical protein